MLVSYEAVVTERMHQGIVEQMIPSALKYFDLPDVIAAIAPRKVADLQRRESARAGTHHSPAARAVRGRGRAAEIAVRDRDEQPFVPLRGAVPGGWPMNAKGAVLFCVSLALCTSRQAAERVECRATADNWVDAPPFQARNRESANHGSDKRLVLYGRNSFALLAFDMSPASGMRIEKAVLRVRREANPVPLTVVGISTISGSGPWSESEMNYFLARQGRPWSYAGIGSRRCRLRPWRQPLHLHEGAGGRRLV